MPDRRPGKHALTFVLLTVLIDMVGLGIVLPVLPGMIGDIAGVDVSEASRIGGWLLVAYSAMQFLFGPVIGNLSDACGRRPVLLLSVFGLGIDYAVTAVAPSVAWLAAGRLIAGVCGASYSTANAYIADITAPGERAKAFGMIGAAFGIGFIIGPALGGFLGEFGHRVPFFAAAGLSLANVLYGYLVLPETLPREKRRPFRLERANPLGALAALRRHPMVIAFAVTLFLHFLATNVYPAIWAYYTIYRYGWSEWEIGLSLAFFGALTALVQGGLVGPFIKRFGERTTAIISLSVEVVIAIGYVFAVRGWMIYVLLVVGAVQGIAMPAINAMMTHRVGEDAQGELQGAIAAITGVTAILGPLMATQLFGAFTGAGALVELPGAPFVATAVLSAIALWVFVRAPGGFPAGREAVGAAD
ncbi:MAG: TCR/Tet family MFS transporter [Methylobacteriaceae bacterium]|nr:TCR/Tet family MFS transporter [Methylobacteriaceae bacterium]